MRGSVLALRTICSPSRSSSVHSPHWPHFIVEAALLASTAPALRNSLGHRAQATKPARAATALLPLLLLRLCAPHPPLFLPPGLFSAPAGVGVFLEITSLPWHTGRQAGTPGLPAGPALAAEPAPPRLAALSAAFPGLLTKATSLASSPQASVARVLPHPISPPAPTKSWGSFRGDRRPSVRWGSRPAP